MRLLLLVLCAVLATNLWSRAAAEPTPTPTTPSSTITPTTPAEDVSTDPPLPPATPENATFGIAPALPVPATQTIDGRPYLKYLAAPGATLRDAVALINLSDKPVTLEVYATDAVQTTDGAFGLLPADEAPEDAGSWFKLRGTKSGKVTVPARKGNKYGQVEVPIEARIPASAEPGDHVAGIVASLVTIGKNKDGARIKFDQRIGLRTYFRISGPVSPGVSIENLRTTYDSHNDIKGQGTVTVSYDIHNTGNVRMYTSQLVTVTAWRRDPVLRYPAPVADILPGSTIHVTETVDQFMIGKVAAEVTLVPKPVDPEIPRGDLVQAEDEVWAWPWLLIALIAGLVLLLLLLIGGGLWWRRRRKRHLAADSDRTKGRSRKATVRKAKAQNDKPRKGTDAPALVPRTARVVAAAIGCAIAGLTFAGPVAAEDVEPGHLILEPDQPTGDPANAITEGFWGHEGPNGDQATVVMADLSGPNGKVTDASQADWIARFGTADFNSIGIAFVPASSDGTAERPAVDEGQNAGEVFDWFSSSALAGAWVGNSSDPRDDLVVPVSTLEEYEGWVLDGKPDQVPNEDLQMINALEPDTPVADFPMGRSIQNRWPAGEKISLVAFRYDGFDANGIPIVHRGKDGHAVTAWLTFRTVASPDDPDLKTSAGYEVLGTSDPPDEGGNGTGIGDQPNDGKGNDRGDGGKDGDRNGGSGGPNGAAADGGTPVDAEGPVTNASWTNLWTGSEWALPLTGLLLTLLLVLVGGTLLLRGDSE